MGTVGTGLPENLAVFTLTLSPPQGAPVTAQGSSSALAGRGVPQIHLHPSLLSGLLKGWNSSGASDGEQIQTRRKQPELYRAGAEDRARGSVKTDKTQSSWGLRGPVGQRSRRGFGKAVPWEEARAGSF